jgi:hypothetical protein
MCCSKWTFLLQSRWTRVKGLYIVTRILPVFLFIGHLYSTFGFSTDCFVDKLTCHTSVNFIPNENPEVCELAVDSLTDNHVTLPEMQDFDYCFLRYVHSTAMFAHPR